MAPVSMPVDLHDAMGADETSVIARLSDLARHPSRVRSRDAGPQ